MKIAIIQFEPKLLDKQTNYDKIKNFVNEIDAELLVFPELSTTGYFFKDKNETNNFSESIESEFLLEIKSLSNSENKGIVLGFAEQYGDKNYNSSALFLPNHPKPYIYRKTHLFYKERFCFNQSETGFFNVYWEEKDINIGMMICYDWRFPESARTLALKGADLIVCPSNLVTDVWHLSMPSRALENKVYFAVSNRYGTETRGSESLTFKGESAIWSYNGSLMAKASKDSDEILIVDIDPLKTRDKSFNEINDIFKDRRPEFYL